MDDKVMADTALCFVMQCHHVGNWLCLQGVNLSAILAFLWALCLHNLSCHCYLDTLDRYHYIDRQID